MFSGIGRAPTELAAAVDQGILCINFESEAELELLSAIAAGKPPRGISVRVIPTSDAKTHAKIARQGENKFGIRSARAAGLCAGRQACGVTVAGSDMHIGSRSRLDPFGNAFALLAGFRSHVRADGHDDFRTSISAAAWAFPIATQRPPPLPDAYRKWSTRHADLAAADLRAGPADRRNAASWSRACCS